MDRIKHDRLVLQQCLDAWNLADAAKTASFYSPECDYRDPTVPTGLVGRAAFQRYLTVLFHRWPEQSWQEDLFMPHSQPGEYSVSYRFFFGNKKKGTSIEGRGMDYIRIENGLVSRNWVYLNASQWPAMVRAISART